MSLSCSFTPIMTGRAVVLGLLLLCVAAEAKKTSGQLRKPSCPNMEEIIACPLNLAPVCGSDGNTYANECTLCAERQNTAVVDCQNGISMDLFLHLSVIPAVFITAVLSFLQKRVKKLDIDHRLPFLEGRFAIVVPLDTLGSLSNRWSYGFAFGAVSSSVLLLFSESYIPFTLPPWAKPIVFLVGALEIGLAYFPFFACLSTPIRPAGAVLGIFYSMAWIIVTVWDTFTCPSGEILGKYQKIIVQWPCILSLVFLLGRFIYILVKAIRIHLQMEVEDPEDLTGQHQMQHVKRLLGKEPAQRKSLNWFQRKVYESDPYFKFPSRIIGTAVISLIGLYAMTLTDYSLSDVVFDSVEQWKDTLDQMANSSNQTEALGTFISELEEFIYVSRKAWLATTIVASLNSVAYTFHVLACYRKHLKRLWKGQKGFLPEKFHNPSSAVSVASITRYSGWQIAFTLWGYLVVHFVHFLFALLFAYILVLPILHGHTIRMLTNLGTIILTIGLVIALVVLQIVLVQIFFLQDKMSPTDKEKPLALNNRKAFHCFNYFFFFYNVVMGISNCIWRLLCSIMAGTWLVSRIDRTIMQRGYESMDAGKQNFKWDTRESKSILSKMADSESIKKMLRSVLQSSKTGVSVSRLQSDYRSLCGEQIPLKKLGYSNLEDYLRSIPSVVRLDYQMGEMRCFAAVCKETAHIAELVAKQKNAKKSGRSQLVNCRMRSKPCDPYMLNVRPRLSLRQPSPGGAFNWLANRSRNHGGNRGSSASGDYRKLDQRLSSRTPVEHRSPTSQPDAQRCVMPERKENIFDNCLKPGVPSPEKLSLSIQDQSCLYNLELVQSRVTQLLEKYSCGLWMSKLSDVYSDMFGQKLHPQALIDLEKWTQICTVEKPSSTRRADRLIYPPLPPSPSTDQNKALPTSTTSSSPINSPFSPFPSTREQPSTPLPSPPLPKLRLSSQSPLAKPTFVFPPPPGIPSSNMSSNKPHSPVHNPSAVPRQPILPFLAINVNGGIKDDQNSPTSTAPLKRSPQPLPPVQTPTNAPPLVSSLPPFPDILPILKVAFPQSSESASVAPSRSSAGAVPAEVRQRIEELLSKYSHGLWSHALPKLFLETYKTPFPEHILDNLSLLLDICTMEHPLPHDKKKAILYPASIADMSAADSQQARAQPLPSGLEVLGSVVPPCLAFPLQQYPSILITDAKSCSAVTIRFVGDSYSNAQEAMEEAMHAFYSQRSARRLSNPTVGQLAAVRGEDGEEVARAQVVEVLASNKVKVYYLDYGFTVETSQTNVLELHQDFLKLPFQATNVRLAGLEVFSSHPVVLSTLDKLAVGKILLMETLEPCQQNEIPVAVLYDTSHDDDVNINSACLKVLQDKTMNNPLTVNVTYQDVHVTNVCTDGTIYCQLPSRGTARLNRLLEDTEAIFSSQITSDSLVARPFSGKICLARSKGKWSRVEIITMYGNRVMDILFIDMGISATVEVTELREIPPRFLKEFTIIPPQVTRCCLADVPVPEGTWSPEVIVWVKEVIKGPEDCKVKISKLDQYRGNNVVYVYLFLGSDSQDLEESINHQLAQPVLWQKLTAQKNNITVTSSVDSGLSVGDHPSSNPVVKTLEEGSHGAGDTLPDTPANSAPQPLTMPPLQELPQPGQNMDVFVPVACHPGHFVLQQWEHLHKLMVLTGEMILYYNKTWKTTTGPRIQKGEIYAAKIDKNWHRVQVKGILANGFVSVYDLDHGKHELVLSTMLRPLIEEFRQLPFQAITAQLAGVTQRQWSEEASMLFRNHVEDRALVAQVESVQGLSEGDGEVWDRKLTVYLVDTAVEDKDLWIHNIMAGIGAHLSSAA
ncbi:uncharacterized protein V6R79_002113 [Siganus canaliculatus]